MITAELLERLHRHYGITPGERLPGGVLVTECGWNGGGAGTRCDALYVGFTSTSGRLLVGHELKVSRSDWLHELDQPHKAGAWADQCHRWYVVAPDTQIVRPEELPHGWGLMVPGRARKRLEVKVKAETYADRVPSWLAVRSIIARQDSLRANAIWQAERQLRDEVERKAQQRALAIADRSDSPGKEARKKLATIEDALGFKIDEYATYRDGTISFDELREACRVVRAGRSLRDIGESLAGRYGPPTQHLRRVLDQVDKAVDDVRAAIDLVPVDAGDSA